VPVVLPASVIAQEHPALNRQANTVYVGADGKYEAQPDTALLAIQHFAQEVLESCL